MSARCNLITHIDVGPGPLRERRPPKRGPVAIGSGAYLGVAVAYCDIVATEKQAADLFSRDFQTRATVVAQLAQLSELVV